MITSEIQWRKWLKSNVSFHNNRSFSKWRFDLKYKVRIVSTSSQVFCFANRTSIQNNSQAKKKQQTNWFLQRLRCKYFLCDQFPAEAVFWLEFLGLNWTQAIRCKFHPVDCHKLCEFWVIAIFENLKTNTSMNTNSFANTNKKNVQTNWIVRTTKIGKHDTKRRKMSILFMKMYNLRRNSKF